ncbi:FtsQ-type POTRA domain-containing protein [Candidatus Peregrinibacteria bacterium]|nr:FtsQ-type POTRA domain-containing protein [Candidatus Peregrinibacteria bacterium]
MIFGKKKPKRLYYPTQSRWYSRPRRRPVERNNKALKKGVKGLFRDWVKRSVYTAIVIAGAGVLFLILFAFSYLSITDIEVVRENFNIDSGAIENELNRFIGKNLLFFPKTQIYHTINTHFPEFAEVKVDKIFPSTIKIELKSHPIVANLRAYYVLPKPEVVTEEESFTELSKAIEELSGKDPNLALLKLDSPLGDEEVTDPIFDLGEGGDEPVATEQKSLLNRIGQAIFDQEENLELMTITVRQLSQPVEDREQVIPKEHMDYILDSIGYFTNAMGLEVLGVDYLPVAREIHLKTEKKLTIWISTERDPKEQVNKLSTIYEPAELDQEDLSYIDLRVKDKVIYCPRNARCDR